MKIVDFHSHILPGIDDGSKNVEMSREMLSRIKSSGVDLVVSTSHFYGNRTSLEKFLGRRQRAFEALAEIPDEEKPEIVLGAEVAFYSGLTRENDLEKLLIEGTNTMLLEMPFSTWTDFELNEVASLCFDRGFEVVIAHLERYVDLEPERMLQQLLKLPVHVQINAGTLLPWRSRRPWLRMFDDGRAELLGSDCHNLASRPPNLAEARDMIHRKLGSSVLRRIDENAERLLRRAPETGA